MIHEVAAIVGHETGWYRDRTPSPRTLQLRSGRCFIRRQDLAFKEVQGRYDGPALETEMLAFWREHDVFQKTLAKSQNGPRFSFNEGPPTANGKPGIHHVLARTFKDVFPRYKTMRGYYAPRKAGWDTHGLPVEHEVEKHLNRIGKIDGYDKQEIETRPSGWCCRRRCSCWWSHRPPE
jgi:isoleucyl-tRNA synthetase